MFEPVPCTRCIYQFNCMVRTEFTDADIKNKPGLNNLTDCAEKHAVKSYQNRNKIQFFTWTLGGDHLILRGGGGGGAGKGRDILFIFSVSSTGKLIFKNTKARIFIFIRNIFLKKQKKKGGEGSECWLRRETGQDFPCVFFLQTTSNAHCRNP